MQDPDLFKMCVGSFNILVKPKVGVVISIMEPPAVNILLLRKPVISHYFIL